MSEVVSVLEGENSPQQISEGDDTLSVNIGGQYDAFSRVLEIDPIS
jgi:hypothetical protein